MMQQQFQANNLKIIFQNINGWLGKKDTLTPILQNLNPDIICMAHTNIHPPHSPIKIHPYITYDCNTVGLYSGVAILIKKDILHSPVNRAFFGDTVAIKVETTMGPIIIACNYSPPARPYLPFPDIMWLARHRTPYILVSRLQCPSHLI